MELPELRIELSHIPADGFSVAVLETETRPELRGGHNNPYQNQIIKRTMAEVFVFRNSLSYVNLVRERLEKEGKDPSAFQPTARAWGVREPDLPLVHHGDMTYLEYVLSVSADTYILSSSNTELTFDELLGVQLKMPGQAGLEDKVFLRTVKIKNITNLILL